MTFIKALLFPPWLSEGIVNLFTAFVVHFHSLITQADGQIGHVLAQLHVHLHT